MANYYELPQEQLAQQINTGINAITGAKLTQQELNNVYQMFQYNMIPNKETGGSLGGALGMLPRIENGKVVAPSYYASNPNARTMYVPPNTVVNVFGKDYMLPAGGRMNLMGMGEYMPPDVKAQIQSQITQDAAGYYHFQGQTYRTSSAAWADAVPQVWGQAVAQGVDKASKQNAADLQAMVDSSGGDVAKAYNDYLQKQMGSMVLPGQIGANAGGAYNEYALPKEEYDKGARATSQVGFTGGGYDKGIYTGAGTTSTTPATTQSTTSTTQPMSTTNSSMLQAITGQLSSGINSTSKLPLTDQQKNSLRSQYKSLTGQDYTVGTTTTAAKTYRAGDINPNTGGIMTQQVADNYNAQIAAGKTTASGSAISQTTTPPPITGTQNPVSAPTANQGANQANTQPNAPTTTTTPTSATNPAADEVLKQYLANGTIDQSTYNLFKEVIGAWNPGTEINTDNILKSFNDITQNTINPYFQEQAKIFTDEVMRAKSYSESERQRELEAQTTQANENIRNTKANLEGRGMTFTGEAGRQLGTESAYTGFGEGLVQQGNRLTASSSAARYQKGLQDLQRQAEQTLGSTASSGMVPGVQQLGGVTGTLPSEKKQAQASTLTNLYNQEQTNYQARQAPQVFSS